MGKGGEPKEVNAKCPEVHPLKNEDTSNCRAQTESVHGDKDEATESEDSEILLPTQTEQSDGECEDKGSRQDVVVDGGVPLQDVEAPCEESRQGAVADGSVPLLDVEVPCESSRQGVGADGSVTPLDRKLPDFLRRVSRIHLLAVIAVLFLIIVVLLGCLAALIVYQQRRTETVQRSAAGNGEDIEVLPPGGDDWIRQGNKCYNFSEVQGNWTVAKDSCTALNSSLAVIDTQEELNFLMCRKGADDHWIGLQRDSGKPWAWVDGRSLLTWQISDKFQIKNEGHAAYLNHNDVRGGEYHNSMNWICMKKN